VTLVQRSDADGTKPVDGTLNSSGGAGLAMANELGPLAAGVAASSRVQTRSPAPELTMRC
jgi:hypothetical protein